MEVAQIKMTIPDYCCVAPLLMVPIAVSTKLINDTSSKFTNDKPFTVYFQIFDEAHRNLILSCIMLCTS